MLRCSFLVMFLTTYFDHFFLTPDEKGLGGGGGFGQKSVGKSSGPAGLGGGGVFGGGGLGGGGLGQKTGGACENNFSKPRLDFTRNGTHLTFRPRNLGCISYAKQVSVEAVDSAAEASAEASAEAGSVRRPEVRENFFEPRDVNLTDPDWPSFTTPHSRMRTRTGLGGGGAFGGGGLVGGGLGGGGLGGGGLGQKSGGA